MPISSHCVHSLTDAIQKDANYFQKNMQIQCSECGIIRPNYPMTGDYSYIRDIANNTVTLESYSILCSPTCKWNWAKTFRFNPEEATTTCSFVLSKMNGLKLNPNRRNPPTWSHVRFGGTCEDADFINPEYSWPHTDSKNPYLYRPWDEQDPIWNTDLTGSGLACWGCLQCIDEKPSTFPIRYCDATKKITHTIGLFHRNGRCALRFKLKRHNMFTWLDIYWSTRLLTEYPFNLDVDTLVASSDPAMLQAFGGPFTLDRFLNAPLNEIYLVTYMGLNAYPYYIKGVLDSVLSLDIIVTEDNARDPMDFGPLIQQPIRLISLPESKDKWSSKFALFVVESIHEVLSRPHYKRLEGKKFKLLSLPESLPVVQKDTR